MSIRVLITGGTFDKEYDELSGNLCFRDTHLPQLLALGRFPLECGLTTLMLKDSLDMNDEDRALIARACREAEEPHIVITHGTDTMTNTAEVLAKEVTGKTIVLTGAMIPFAFGASDALFNLGSALTAVQLLPKGVYVAMNGQVFPWNQVRKNRELGKFEATQP
jgi:L-asparaginase/archaeal Glu-tRNAGln amidotransferase subunit D